MALGMLLGLGLLAATRAGARGRPHKPPPGYATLARLLADDLEADPALPRPVPDLDHARARCRDGAAELAHLAPGDPEVDTLASRARSALEDAAASLGRLDALPRPPGAVALFAEGVARGYVGDVLGVIGRALDLQGRQSELEAEVHRLLSAMRRIEAATLELPRLAARFAGPPAPGPPPIAVDLDAAWGPVGPDDRITLVNRSGAALHDCTVLVELRGPAGETARNAHFVPEWPAGGPISARYSPGGGLPGEAMALHTVPGVESVIVSAWADELRCEGMAWAYSGPERDLDVGRCLGPMRVAAEYRPFSRGLLWNTQRGLRVRLEGLAHLDHPTIAARFRRGGAEASLSWSFERWDEGETKDLDGAGRLPWDPEGWELVVSFPGTSADFRADWPPPSP